MITGNQEVALAHFNHIQKLLTVDNPLTEPYHQFIREYLCLNHMTRILNADKSLRYFIPYHAVLKPSSTTAKLCVIYNVSSKSLSGVSLNDILMNGPVLQPELFDVLLRIYLLQHLITGDVEKMYRCTYIHPEDRKYKSI